MARDPPAAQNARASRHIVLPVSRWEMSRPSRPSPVTASLEREFGVRELFFSTTDRKGIIRSGNHVFQRVSAYERDELIGRPHNLIRHPDMPRAVFQLLWDELEAGRPIAAYVKNLAKDGRPYWVMATVVPIDDGYLSVRLKPTTPLLAAAQAVYADALAREREVEGNDPKRRKAAIAAGLERIGERLAEAGFPTYAAFMHTALPAEVQRRATLLGDRSRTPAAATGGDPLLHRVRELAGDVSHYLDGLVAKLDDYVGLSRTLAEKSEVVLGLAEDVRLFSLNALLAAAHGTGDGATIGAVASIMGSRTDASDPVFRALNADIASAVGLLDGLFFPISTTKIQAEVAIVFVDELLAGMADVDTAPSDLAALARCLGDGIDRLVEALAGLDARVRRIDDHAVTLRRDLKVLRALEMNGRIEAARGAEGGSVVALFTTIGTQVGAARREMDELAAVGRMSFGREAAAVGRLRTHVDALRAEVARLAA